jgi:hypothetical protein
MSEPRCLLVCVGKDCRSSAGFGALVDAASQVRGSCEVPCQDLCHGPIVGVRIGDGLRWFHRIRGKRLRKALVRSVEQGRIDDELRELEVRGHRDELRHRKKVRPLRAA